MDFPSPESVEATYREVSELVPHINVLVNNAGVFSVRAFEELTLEEWRRVIDVNLTGVFLVARTFLLLLKKAPWADIVNVSSIAGQTGNVFASVACCASKAGVIGLTRRLTVELAPHIRVNAVAPSFVETDMTRSMLDTPEKRKAIAELHRSHSSVASCIELYLFISATGGFITATLRSPHRSPLWTTGSWESKPINNMYSSKTL